MFPSQVFVRLHDAELSPAIHNLFDRLYLREQTQHSRRWQALWPSTKMFLLQRNFEMPPMKQNPLSAISVSSLICVSMSSTPRSPPRRTSRLQENGTVCRRKSSVWWRKWWGFVHTLLNSLNQDPPQILDGTRAGLALPEKKRDELTTLKKELSQVCLEFSVC